MGRYVFRSNEFVSLTLRTPRMGRVLIPLLQLAQWLQCRRSASTWDSGHCSAQRESWIAALTEVEQPG